MKQEKLYGRCRGISRYFDLFPIIAVAHRQMRIPPQCQSPSCTTPNRLPRSGRRSRLISMLVRRRRRSVQHFQAPISGFESSLAVEMPMFRGFGRLASHGHDWLLHMRDAHPSETGCSPSVWAQDAARILLVSNTLPEGLRSR